MPSWSDAVAAALRLPGVEESTTYGAAPAMKVRGKIVCWMRNDPEAFVVRVPDLGEKEALLAEAPEIYFTTPHYDGYAYVLVRLEAIPADALEALIEDSWRISAAKRVVASYDAERADAGDGPDGGDAGSSKSS